MGKAGALLPAGYSKPVCVRRDAMRRNARQARGRFFRLRVWEPGREEYFRGGFWGKEEEKKARSVFASFMRCGHMDLVGRTRLKAGCQLSIELGAGLQAAAQV